MRNSRSSKRMNNKLQKNISRYRYCPECGKKLKLKETFFGYVLTCKKCGLGVGCNKQGEIDKQSKKAWKVENV